MDPYQSGYRKNHSTETALLKIQNDILQSLDQNCIVALVLLDVSAAFDLVNHNSLLKYLRDNFGIKGTVLN